MDSLLYINLYGKTNHIQKLLYWFITQSNYLEHWKYSMSVSSGPPPQVSLDQKGYFMEGC